MIDTSIDIGDGNLYDIETPNDLLYSPIQRFEIHRHVGLYVVDVKDTALVTLILSWKGFSQTRHYSVPWSGSSGYAVVFPDFSQIGYTNLWALYTEAHIEVRLDGEYLTEGDMRVATYAARAFDTLSLGDNQACVLSLAWLDERGTRFTIPVSVQSITNSGRQSGYSPSGSFSTKAGPVAVYRQWKTINRSASLVTAPVSAAEVDYLSTIGETPFVELRNTDTGDIYRYDDVNFGGVSLNARGMATATISISGLNEPLP